MAVPIAGVKKKENCIYHFVSALICSNFALELHFGMGNITYKNEEQLKATVRTLAKNDSLCKMCHLRLSSEPLPQQSIIQEIITLSRSLLFPGFFGDYDVNSYNLEYIIGIQCERLKAALENQILAGLVIEQSSSEIGSDDKKIKAESIAAQFIAHLPELRQILHTDVSAMYVGDPAAMSYEEVIYCYPAIKAIINYRIAHELYLQDVPIIPRMICESAHSETGIDIHPGATIGSHFAIDHGTGVVIGATARLYRGRWQNDCLLWLPDECRCQFRNEQTRRSYEE